MKTYLIYAFAFFFYFYVARTMVSYKKQDTFTQIILYWMIFCIFVGLLELVLFFKSNYISRLPHNKTTDFWLRDIASADIMHSHYWSHAWKEYGDGCDTRYTQSKNIVHWIEIIHALTSFIYIYIIYQFMTKKNSMLIGILLVVISSIHLFNTLVYFVTFKKYLNKNPIKKTTKFWSYLSLNFFWILMPILLLVKGGQMISSANT